MPRHGGDISVAISKYGGKPEDWLDLSTGVSPWSYPLPKLNDELWRTLPKKPSNLLAVASNYYACDRGAIALVPGTQPAIRLLPTFIKASSTVAVPEPGYQEHAYSWSQAGHQLMVYQNLEHLAAMIAQGVVEHAVVINPNNPTCESTCPELLNDFAKRLEGLLVIDEAFTDVDPRNSLCNQGKLDNIIIFRSIGKFFGLAGARIGFVISHHNLAHKLGRLFSPWPVNAAAQRIAEVALNDLQWQTTQRKRLAEQASQVSQILEPIVRSANERLTQNKLDLFTTITGPHDALNYMHTELAKKQVWARLGNANKQQNNWLRLSLPGDRIAKLSEALDSLTFQTLNQYRL